jgi:hypothetical protein
MSAPNPSSLRKPVSQLQIEAATRLRGRLKQWQASDAALDALREKFPDFSLASSLLKVATINTLYGTNVYAVMRMAQHVSDVMARAGPGSAALDIVERLSSLPPLPGKKPMRHLSFASKFAHFFIDSERFPIWDSYARTMVKHHLGLEPKVSASGRYADFVRRFHELRAISGHRGSIREFDGYLWLAGIKLARDAGEQNINAEVKNLLDMPPPGSKQDFHDLLGQSGESLPDQSKAGGR